MKKSSSILTLSMAAAALAFHVSSPPAQAQNESSSRKNTASESTGKRSFWEVYLPGGSFTVHLSKIASVSKHEYLVDGAARVVEVNIDTVGNALVRFYFIEPSSDGGQLNVARIVGGRAEDIARKVTDRTGTQEVWRQAIKSYPASTHAHTIEFRLEDEGNLDAIAASARSAWMSGIGKKLTIKDS